MERSQFSADIWQYTAIIMNKKLLLIRKFEIIIALLLFLAGCNMGNKSQVPTPEQQSLEDDQQSEKPPDHLKGIEENIEKIINALNAPSVGIKDKKEQEGNAQGGGQGGAQGQQQKQQGGQQDQSGQKPDEQKKAAELAPAKPDQWQEIIPTIDTLHYQWNEYMPMAAKSGATQAVLDNFSNALNNLTSAAISKNSANTLMAVNQAYSFIPDFYMLYKTKNSPEIKRIRHYTRTSMLNAMSENWGQAGSDINKLKASWSVYKNTLGKEQQDLSRKMDFSLNEYEKVVKNKNGQLCNIKGKVLLANVTAIEKSMEDKAAKGGS